MHISPPIHDGSRVLIADTPASVLLVEALDALLSDNIAKALNANSADRQPTQPAPAASRIGDNPDAVMLRVIADLLGNMLHQSHSSAGFRANYDRLALVTAIACGDWRTLEEGPGALAVNRERVAKLLPELTGSQCNSIGVTFNKVRELAQC